MAVNLDVEYEVEDGYLPSPEDLQVWTNLALQKDIVAQLSVRIVNEAESQAINKQYRGKDKPTNVLSFPLEMPEDIGMYMLGDLLICAPVVEREALEQHKPIKAHWAHMVIHGMLHLQGYDHISDNEANEMESLEIQLLQQLGYDNPYETILE